MEGDIVNPGGSMTGGGAVSPKVFCLKRRVDNNETPLEDYLRQTESFEQQFKDKSDQLSELYFEKSKA